MSNIPENTNLQQITLFEKRKIVEHNDLITSVAKMDKVPLKIFELAVSCIDINNPPKDNIIYLSKKELFSFFKVVDNDKHSRFKEAIEKMQKQAYFQIREKIDKGFEFESIIPIPYIKWNDYDDEVTIRFDIAIMPYLIDLKQNFTQYALSDIMELNSKYSIILYKWLSMNYNQYLHYKDNGGRRFEQLEAYRNPSISIPDLRSLTDTVNEYKEMSNFTRELLNKPSSQKALGQWSSPPTQISDWGLLANRNAAKPTASRCEFGPHRRSDAREWHRPTLSSAGRTASSHPRLCWQNKPLRSYLSLSG